MKRIFLAAALAAIAFATPALAQQVHGDLSGFMPSPTVAKVNGATPGGACASHEFVTTLSNGAVPACAQPAAADVSGLGGLATLTGTAQGQVAYYNGSSWVALSPGTAGQLLATGGGGANPSWSSHKQIAGSHWTGLSTAGVTYFGSFFDPSPAQTVEQLRNIVAPFSGTIRNLYVYCNTAPTGANTDIFTVRVNGATPSGAPTVTLTGSAVSGSDTSSSGAAVSAGQYFGLQLTVGASATPPANCEVSAEIDSP